ncbi:MAG: CBS domain-containing protein [Acidimicrobiales bacterium]
MEVYDYVPGKAAWLASGRPVEGEAGAGTRAGPVARRDVPTCGLHEPVGDVRPRVGDWPVVVVVQDGVVLGLVRAEALGLDPATPVEEVMRPGPSTFRPSISCDELATYLRDHHVPRALVTSLDGRLVGMASLGDLEACAGDGGGDGDGGDGGSSGG